MYLKSSILGSKGTPNHTFGRLEPTRGHQGGQGVQSESKMEPKGFPKVSNWPLKSTLGAHKDVKRVEKSMVKSILGNITNKSRNRTPTNLKKYGFV